MKKNILVISILVIVFGIYNIFIYTSKNNDHPIELSKKALKGQQLWQENNCWACHQIYGLGGYLGPDLTNIYSSPGKGDNYIKAFLNAGVKAMPVFHFSEEEKDQLAAYLKYVDSTGYFPNYDAQIDFLGWVKIKTKDDE